MCHLLQRCKSGMLVCHLAPSQHRYLLCAMDPGTHPETLWREEQPALADALFVVTGRSSQTMAWSRMSRDWITPEWPWKICRGSRSALEGGTSAFLQDTGRAHKGGAAPSQPLLCSGIPRDVRHTHCLLTSPCSCLQTLCCERKPVVLEEDR